MNLRRLRFLLELSRRGSMRAVADATGHTTSTVSQQLAQLAREAGTALVEPEGRNVRLTPAGRRLAEHAVTILAAVDAARADLDPRAEPEGEVRVAGFASAIRRTLVPTLARLAADHPAVRLRVREHEPPEAFAALAAHAVDLALVYDYDLAPASVDLALDRVPLWSAPWGLGVPRSDARGLRGAGAADVFRRFADHAWIANSRHTADEHAVRTIASIAGFAPDVVHRADSLELVQDLIVAGHGVGLLPLEQPVDPGVRVLTLRDPGVTLRAYAVTRRGRDAWAPLALVRQLVAAYDAGP